MSDARKSAADVFIAAGVSASGPWQARIEADARAARRAHERHAIHGASRTTDTIAELRRRLGAVIDEAQAKHTPVPGAPPDPALAVRRATLDETERAISVMLDALPVEAAEVSRG